MARFGSLGTQYFDDSGDPLVSGKIYFYETGTNTKKNTYSDAELTILNSHPVLLSGAGRQPNIFFEGLARAVLTKNNDTQVEVRDPVATADDTSTVIVNEIRERGILHWSDVVDYTEGALVIGSDNYVYRAAQASGPSTATQDPTLTADYWFGPSDIRRPSMTADSVADLRSKFAGAPDKALVETLGYYTPGDGGSGRYRKDASDTISLDNGGTIIVANDGARWKLIHNGVVYATQFGATFNGSDTAAALQACITASVGLFDVDLLDKTYSVIASITIPSNCRLRGSDATIKALSSNRPVTGTGVSNIKIEGVIFDSSSLADDGCRFLGCSSLKLRSCKGINGLRSGFRIEQTTRSDLTLCMAESNGSGNTTDGGFNLSGELLTLSQCRAKSNNGNGFYAFGDSTYQGGRNYFGLCVSEQNTRHGFLTNSIGGATYAPSQVTFSACVASNNGESGLYSGFSLHFSSQSKCVGCTSHNNQEHGFVLMDAIGQEITGCTARNNQRTGVRIQGDFSRAQDANTGVQNPIVTSNLIYGNGTGNPGGDTNYGGMTIQANCFNITVNDNHIFSNNGYSVRVKTKAGYTDSYNIFCDQNFINSNTSSDAITNESTSEKRLFGTNYITGVQRPTLADGSNSRVLTKKIVNWDAVSGTVSDIGEGELIEVNLTNGTNITVDTINTGLNGRLIYLRFIHSSSGTSVTLKHLTGNLKLLGSDIVTTNSDIVVLLYAGNFWNLVGTYPL